MADDYAFPQAMVRGLGAVPQGVGAGGSGGAPGPVGPTPARTDPMFHSRLWAWYAYGPKPVGAPQGGRGEWKLVSQLGSFGSASYGPTFQLPAWVWYPHPAKTELIWSPVARACAVTNGQGSAGSSAGLIETFPLYWVNYAQYEVGGIYGVVGTASSAGG